MLDLVPSMGCAVKTHCPGSRKGTRTAVPCMWVFWKIGQGLAWRATPPACHTLFQHSWFPLPTLREPTQRAENLPVKWRALSCLHHTAADLRSLPTEPAEQHLAPSLGIYHQKSGGRGGHQKFSPFLSCQPLQNNSPLYRQTFL